VDANLAPRQAIEDAEHTVALLIEKLQQQLSLLIHSAVIHGDPVRS
jgi:hypothetical protein